MLKKKKLKPRKIIYPCNYDIFIHKVSVLHSVVGRHHDTHAQAGPHICLIVIHMLEIRSLGCYP